MKLVPSKSNKPTYKLFRVVASSSLLWGVCSLPFAATGLPNLIAQSNSSNLLPLQGIEIDQNQPAVDVQPDSSNLLPLQGIETDQSQPAVEADEVEPFNFLQPSPPPIEETSLNKIGLLRDISATELTVRGINGNDETFPLSSQLTSLPQMTRGALVSFRLEQSEVAEVDIPIVKTMFEGSLVVVEDNVLGLVSAAGERKFARLSPEKIASLDIEPGQTIQLIEFEGIKTKVICSPETDKRVPLFVGAVDDSVQNF